MQDLSEHLHGSRSLIAGQPTKTENWAPMGARAVVQDIVGQKKIAVSHSEKVRHV